MILTPEFVTAVGGLLVGVIGAASVFYTKRGQHAADELKALRVEVTALRKQQQAVARYFGKLIRLLNFHDLEIPEPPEGLFDDLPYRTRRNGEARGDSSGNSPDES